MRLSGAVLLSLAAFLGTVIGSLGLSMEPPSSSQSFDTGVTARLRGISAPGNGVVWASGTGGTVVRTTDGGESWKRFPVEGAEGLDLRDIDAFDENVAYALSIGSGADSRIFKTIDGGASWQTQFVNPEPEGFFDAMAFWDAERGVAVSDSIDGKFYVLRTEDGGARWTRVPPEGLPEALPGEGYFAASGTNVATWGTDRAWFGTGAAERARVARSTDGGETWQVVDTPLPAGPTSGIYSVFFLDAERGVVVGGDYRLEDEAADNAAFTDDGGRTWKLAESGGLTGFRSAVDHGPGAEGLSLVAVGPTGGDFSTDGGRTWRPFPVPRGLHAISFSRSDAALWGAGNDGIVARLAVPSRPVAPRFTARGNLMGHPAPTRRR